METDSIHEKNLLTVLKAIETKTVTLDIVKLANQIPLETIPADVKNAIGIIAGAFGDLDFATEYAAEELKSSGYLAIFKNLVLNLIHQFYLLSP